VSAERKAAAANGTGGTRTRVRGQSESGFSIWPAVGTAGGTAAARRTVEIDWEQRTAAAAVKKMRTERAAAKARWAAGKMKERQTWGEEMRGVEMIEGLVVEAAATETSVGKRRTDAAAVEMIGEKIEEEEEEGATINRSPVIVVAGRTGRGG
jgi:hypothetical protein